MWGAGGDDHPGLWARVSALNRLSMTSSTVLRCEVQVVMITPGYELELAPLTGSPGLAYTCKNSGRSSNQMCGYRGDLHNLLPSIFISQVEQFAWVAQLSLCQVLTTCYETTTVLAALSSNMCDYLQFVISHQIRKFLAGLAVAPMRTYLFSLWDISNSLNWVYNY
jgi:hypothetical protein